MPLYSMYSKGEQDIRYLVTDLNGTLCVDNVMINGVKERFDAISALGIEIYVITGDIHGTAEQMLKDYKCNVHVVDILEKEERQDQQKLNLVNKLGAQNVVAMGNGANDCLMLEGAAIGVLVIEKEGGCTKSLVKSDIVVGSINDGLDLLLFPKRIAGH